MLDLIYDDVRNNTPFDIDYNETKIPAQKLWYGLNRWTYPANKYVFTPIKNFLTK